MYFLFIKNNYQSSNLEIIQQIEFSFIDKPSSPEGPLEVLETTPTAITVQWKPPKDNGGSKIERYVLEKKQKGSNKWSKVPGNIGPNDTQATAKNLDEGEEYEFRVTAVNENGESDPLITTEPVKAKYPFGMTSILLAYIIQVFVSS